MRDFAKLNVRSMSPRKDFPACFPLFIKCFLFCKYCFIRGYPGFGIVSGREIII